MTKFEEGSDMCYLKKGVAPEKLKYRENSLQNYSRALNDLKGSFKIRSSKYDEAYNVLNNVLNTKIIDRAKEEILESYAVQLKTIELIEKEIKITKSLLAHMNDSYSYEPNLNDVYASNLDYVKVLNEKLKELDSKKELLTVNVNALLNSDENEILKPTIDILKMEIRSINNLMYELAVKIQNVNDVL